MNWYDEMWQRRQMLQAELDAAMRLSRADRVTELHIPEELVTPVPEAIRANLERARFQNVLPSGQRRLDGRRRRR